MRIAHLAFSLLSLAPAVASAQTVDRSESSALVAWINEARAERHLDPLVEDPRLDGLAETHSADMATWGYFSHQSPRTGTVEDRAATAGVRWRALGENIAFNQSTRMAHEALLRSPGHYANITGSYRAVGVGIVRSSDGVYVTEVFGTLTDSAPARVTPPPQVAPVAPSSPDLSAPPAAPRDDRRPTPPRDDPWAAMGLPPFMQSWGIPWPSMQPPGAAPTAPSPSPRTRGPNTADGTRNCEVDTPFGHVSITIAGTGIDTATLPCNPDAQPPAAQPRTQPATPSTAPRVRPPSRRSVPRIEIPPVPMPTPSSEPLGAPATI
jgi:Cysteine-rich secretory protein family